MIFQNKPTNTPNIHNYCCPVVTWKEKYDYSPHTNTLNNRYQIINTIKKGSMGTVSRARDLADNSIVAIKKMVIPPDNSGETLYIHKQLNREAEILNKLNHRGIPRFIDFFTDIDHETGRLTNYLVMAYISGIDLETLMHERLFIPFTPEEALPIFRQLLGILSYLHSRKPPVIYRDLKLSNIICRNDDLDISLIDFGIAREYAPGARGIIVGTPGYAPPEQYGGYSTEKSDLYALGAVMHCLLTGINPENPAKPPFKFDTIKNHNPEVPQYLESIILSLLESNPDYRPASAIKVRKQLDRFSRNQNQPFKLRIRNILTSKLNPIGGNPLHTAAINGNIRELKIHAFCGIDVNQPDLMGMTPLHHAAAEGHYEAVKTLIKEHAQLEIPDRKGWTPLFHAVEKGHHTIVSLLLEKGADKNRRLNDNSTILHTAAEKGHEKIIDILLRKGVDIEARNRFDETPLHLAVRKKQRKSILLLLTRGADVNARNRMGWTPLTLAQIRFTGNDIINILKNRGAYGKNLLQMICELY